VSTLLAGWQGTPLPEWVGSWWAFGAIVAIVGAVAWWLFRSLRRWKQPPRRPDAMLDWMTYRNLPD
jgi:hypothetical protein